MKRVRLNIAKLKKLREEKFGVVRYDFLPWATRYYHKDVLYQQISKMESGALPMISVELLWALAKALGIKMEDLLIKNKMQKKTISNQNIENHVRKLRGEFEDEIQKEN